MARYDGVVDELRLRGTRGFVMPDLPDPFQPLEPREVEGMELILVSSFLPLILILTQCALIKGPAVQVSSFHGPALLPAPVPRDSTPSSQAINIPPRPRNPLSRILPFVNDAWVLQPLKQAYLQSFL